MLVPSRPFWSQAETLTMQRLRGFARRFRFPWRSLGQIRREVDDEIAFHLAEKTEALERTGLSRDEARDEALRQFGDLETARGRLVAVNRWGERYSAWLRAFDSLARDAKHAWRSMLRTPGFTVVATLVLALGIGVVCAAFSLVNVMALKPVLIDEPDRVVGIFALEAGSRDGRAFSYQEYVELRERAKSFSELAAYDVFDPGIEEGEVSRRIMASLVSANYFETFGVPLAQGRSFTLAEERGEGPAVAIVSHEFWVRNGSDPALVGSLVRVNGEPFLVVGVAARGFTGTMALLAVDLWLPLAAAERIELGDGRESPSLGDPRDRSFLLVGRLQGETAKVEAETELAALAPTIDANLPAVDGATYTYIVGELGRFSIGDGPNPDEGLLGTLILPFALSTVVLLIACLNLANMFLARGASRRTELAIRQSLGSGRIRMVRQLLAECVLLAMLGGPMGLILAYWATSRIAASFARAFPIDLTLVVDMRPDARVLLVTTVACLAATLLFGLGPAWRVTGKGMLSGLKREASAFGGRSRALPSGRSVMLIAQVALSLAMLTAGGLFVRSALVAADAAPPFDLDSKLLVELDPSLVGYDEARVRDVYRRVKERLRALPQIEHAGLASVVPLSGLTHSTSVQRAGSLPGERGSSTNYAVIDDGYFDALSLPMLRGRAFTVAEISSSTSAAVAIIDAPLAERLFPDEDPLGKKIQLPSRKPDVQPPVLEIVGIAPGTPGADFDPAPDPHVYVPFGQEYSPSMQLVVALREGYADPSLLLSVLRREIRAIDPSLPVLSMSTMRELRDNNWNLWMVQTGGTLFAILGVLALFLAMAGLYGVRAYLVLCRTREIGVRIALGATRGDVLRLMLRESMTLTVAGLVLGWILALVLGRLLSGLLFGVSPMDPSVLLSASVLLILAATLASYLPVRRATLVEPTAALRHE